MAAPAGRGRVAARVALPRFRRASPPPPPLQELAARRELRVVGTELVQQARAALAAGGGSGGATNGSGSAVGSQQRKQLQRPTAVDPGSFLALILPSVGRPLAGVRGGVLNELWAANQATGFILAG